MINNNSISIIIVLAIMVSFFGYVIVTDSGLFGARTTVPLWDEGLLEVQVLSGDFNASTTVFGVLNPLGATSTLDFLSYDQTGKATSTYILNCGTSTSIYGGVATPSDYLIDGIEFATNTKMYLTNGITPAAGTNSKDRIEVGADEAVSCVVTTAGTDFDDAFTNTSSTYEAVSCVVTTAGTDFDDAFTNTSSTFDGTYVLRFSR